jgi:hypothetical protein
MKADPPLMSIYFRHTGLKYAINRLRIWLGRADGPTCLSILLSHLKPSAIGGGYPFYGGDGDPAICGGAGH